MAGTALKRLMAEYKRESRSPGPSRCLPGGIAPKAREGPQAGRGRGGRGAGQAAGLPLGARGSSLYPAGRCSRPRRLQGPLCVRTELLGAGVRVTGPVPGTAGFEEAVGRGSCPEPSRWDTEGRAVCGWHLWDSVAPGA